jgi:hypothetical protein
MKCIYYYKGKLIGDEIKLNDFLIERKQLHSKYGDIVFELSVLAGQVMKIIDEDIIPDSNKWQAKYDELWKSGQKLYDDDGEKLIIYDKDHPPFIGVNKYIDKFGSDSN